MRIRKRGSFDVQYIKGASGQLYDLFVHLKSSLKYGQYLCPILAYFSHVDDQFKSIDIRYRKKIYRMNEEKSKYIRMNEANYLYFHQYFIFCAWLI